jgi:anti-anti-sigma regulatory factor
MNTSADRTRTDQQGVDRAGERGTVLVLRGAIRGRAEDELRRALRAAIADGAVVVLDLTEVETFASSARELVASAGTTLADRGGALLAWTTNDAGGERSHVMRELRNASTVVGGTAPDTESELP